MCPEEVLILCITSDSLETVLHTVRVMFWMTQNYRLYSFETLFIRNVYDGFTTCPSVLEAVSIRVTVRNIREFSTFSTSFHVTNILLFAVPWPQIKYTSIAASMCLAVTFLISSFRLTCYNQCRYKRMSVLHVF
jgi:hypothetical protein